MINRKLRMGMIGGGKGAFIGTIHRAAALMDNQIELVCGCFSSKPEVSLASGREYFLPDDRIYTSYQQMIEREAALPEERRMDFVSIVTPNQLHFGPAAMAMEHGFDVVLDKPITFSLEEAYRLRDKVEQTGRTLALTHTYSGYPGVKEARERFARGDFGKIRKIFVEYTQGWFSTRVELDPASNAGWRTDPSRSGKAGTMGDIGTHALQLAEYISGQRCTSLCADLRTVVEGRLLDDDGAALLRFDGGATGVLVATQVAAGEENPLTIRIYGHRWNRIRCTSNGTTDRWRSYVPGMLTWEPLQKPTPARPADIPKVTSKPLRTFTGISHVPCGPGGAGKRPGRNGRIFRM
mgnify:CR=1 FL=1